MTPEEKYIATARLGEGVIYVSGDNEFQAGIIVGQQSETIVDLLVIPVTGQFEVKRNVELDPMANKPGCWAPRPKQ